MNHCNIGLTMERFKAITVYFIRLIMFSIIESLPIVVFILLGNTYLNIMTAQRIYSLVFSILLWGGYSLFVLSHNRIKAKEDVKIITEMAEVPKGRWGR